MRGVYEYLGEGSSRKVYDLNNGYVIKIAKNRAGVEQNKSEYSIYIRDNMDLFASIIQASEDYGFIVMRKGIKIKNISRVWKYFNVNNAQEFSEVYEIRKIKNKYNLLMADINKKSSWGIVDGKMKLIDYGYTKRVKEKYYAFK